MPIHRLYQLLADIKTQAAASYSAGNITLQAHKLAEEQRNFILWNARACIFHTDTHIRLPGSLAVLACPQTGADSDRSMLGSIFKGIGEQIAQHLAQRLLVTPYRQVFSNIQVYRVSFDLTRIE